MSQKKFKVGDVVRATKESNKKYNCTNEKNGYVGTVISVEDDDCIAVQADRDKVPYYVDPQYFALVKSAFSKHEVHITTDGKTTHAMLKENGKVVKRAEAKCSPEDTFDFKVGAQLAFERLFGLDKEAAPVEEKKGFKVGDRVQIREWDDMKEEFGSSRLGIDCQYGFTLKMKYLCGRKATITGIGFDNSVRLQFDDDIDYKCWNYSTDMIKHIDEPKKAPVVKFVPHLVYGCYDEYLGNIGELSPFKDVLGRELHVGDTVELYNEDAELRGEYSIVNDNEHGYFVMSIRVSCEQDGTINGGWKIIKKRSYKDIENGEYVDDVKYIKEAC